jgi:hypothetical protein
VEDNDSADELTAAVDEAGASSYPMAIMADDLTIKKGLRAEEAL